MSQTPLPPPPGGPTPTSEPVWKRWWFWAIAGVVVLIGISEIAPGATSHSPATVAATPSPAPSPTPNLSPTPTPSSSPSVTVVLVKGPDVIGLYKGQAEAAIQQAVNHSQAGARLSLRYSNGYSRAPAGSVISASAYTRSGLGPIAGKLIPSGNVIHLVLARPIPIVPDVVGEPLSAATREMKHRGYTVRTRQKESTLPQGQVLAQSVAAGSRKIPGGTIVLTVAKPQPGVFIQVIGSGSALITWIEGDFDEHQVTENLPFTTRVSTGGAFSTITMSAQRQLGDSGSITCEIISFGKVVKKSTSSGPYTICSVTR